MPSELHRFAPQEGTSSLWASGESSELMDLTEKTRLRLSAQRALLGHVTPRLRAVSLDFDVEGHRVWTRFIFDGEPSDWELDAAACAGAQIIADCPEGWTITEDVVLCMAPAMMGHLAILVYARSEDECVADDAPVCVENQGTPGAKAMTRDESALLDNVLDSLDRLFDRDSKVIDVHALLFATSRALERSRFRPDIEPFVGALRAIIRTQAAGELQRDEALRVTDALRQFLANVLPKPAFSKRGRK